MIKLMKKDFRLAMHPTTIVFILLSAMVLIPNYPYSVIFFYTTLGLFFTCLLGRENNDVVYSLTLPVSKRDIVRARIGYTVAIELIQMAVMVPLVLLRQSLEGSKNEAGIDANIALFAMAFIIYGVYNLVFFTRYYKNVSKVGISFAISSVVTFILVALEVVSTYAIPFVRDYLDKPDPEYLSYKLIALAAGFVFYLLLTLIACAKSIRSFERQDL